MHKLLYITIIYLLKEKRLTNEYDEVDKSARNSVAYAVTPQSLAKEKGTTTTKSDTAPADDSTGTQALQYDYVATGITVRKFT